MPSDAMTAATRPPFPTYLLPSFNSPIGLSSASSYLLPFRHRRRHSSTTSTTSSLFSNPSLSTSPISPAWSPNTTPSSSPPVQGGIGAYFAFRPRSATSPVREEAELQDERAGNGDGGYYGRKLARTHPDTLKCSACATDIAFASQIISKGFTGRHGRAYLVSAPPLPAAPKTETRSSEQQGQKDKDKEKEGDKNGNKAGVGDLVNTKVGRPVSRQLVTGAHVVADISCLVCGQVVGWKYVDAKEAAQRYKIGKFILETRRVVGARVWEDVEGEMGGEDDGVSKRGEPQEVELDEEETVEFDSEDEDECEDLFTGVWDAEVVRKRRQRRVGARQRAEA